MKSALDHRKSAANVNGCLLGVDGSADQALNTRAAASGTGAANTDQMTHATQSSPPRASPSFNVERNPAVAENRTHLRFSGGQEAESD
jgi:hypothetical protein